MQVKKVIHGCWDEYEKLKEKNPNSKIKEPIGKWQYLYSSDKGEISLIQLKDYFKEGRDLWEIREISLNNLFEDVERFAIKKDAEKRIKELLE